MIDLDRRLARILAIILASAITLEPAAFAMSASNKAAPTTGNVTINGLPALPGSIVSSAGIGLAVPNVTAAAKSVTISVTAPKAGAQPGAMASLQASAQVIEQARPGDTQAVASEQGRLYDAQEDKGAVSASSSDGGAPSGSNPGGSGANGSGGGQDDGGRGSRTTLKASHLPRTAAKVSYTRTVFPGSRFNGSMQNGQLLKDAQGHNGGYFLLTTPRAADDGGTAGGVFPVATLMKVVSLENDGTGVRFTAIALREAVIKAEANGEATVSYPEEEHRDLAAENFHAEKIKEAFQENAPKSKLTQVLAETQSAKEVARILMMEYDFSDDESEDLRIKQTLLASLSTERRLAEVAKRVVGAAETSAELSASIQSAMMKANREYQLRMQIEQAQKMLGIRDDAEVKKLEKIFESKRAGMNADAVKAVEIELAKAKAMSGNKGAEYFVSTAYVERMLAMPWGAKTTEVNDLALAEKILNDDHEGLDEIKERVLEFLAIRMSAPKGKGVVLAFDGPPGVGKTSISISIARALGLKFERLSLGGVRDEAEIRGHRRTYIGALPGKIVEAVKKTGVDNPAILLDEIDKMSSDQRGDPASAMLEVLDPSQNHSFRDHYLDVPYDLSKVFFLATSNVLGNIPGPLRDRMQIIQLGSYTEKEKVAIAANHLVRKQTEENGLPAGSVTLTPETILTIIRGYTREGGVRNLERAIGSLMRKIAVRHKTRNEPIPQTLAAADVKKYLGEPRFEDFAPGANGVGQATGLAVNSFGGDVLAIETLALPKGSTGRAFTVSGQLKEVMTESSQISLRRAILWATKNGVTAEALAAHEISLHVPDGATPKDGPSAGITMLTALASLMTGRAVRKEVAMTGELTLTGRVTAIGGLKEKALAAQRMGYTELVISHENAKDMRALPKELRESFKWHVVKTDEEVLAAALEKDGTPLKAPASAATN